MLEQIILGTIQGIVEWLPISSEGAIIFARNALFGSEIPIEELLRSALLLHMGTFLAALIYFRKDVLRLIQAAFNFRNEETQWKNILIFLAISTFVSGVLGLSFFILVSKISFAINIFAINVAIGLLLLVTGFLQIKAGKNGGLKREVDANFKDGLIAGIAQGFAVFPGLSRSGLTVSALLLRKYNDDAALRLSFLMSLPIILAGNLILNFKELAFSPNYFVGLAFSFIFGLLTIGVLLEIAKKINFGYFVLIFALLVFASAFIR